MRITDFPREQCPRHRAAAYLMRAAPPPAPALSRFVTEVGLVDAARRVRAGEVPADVEAELPLDGLVDRVDADFAAAARCEARLILPGDAHWPRTMIATPRDADGENTCTPPIGLWLRGALTMPPFDHHAVAIIGARAATGYGEQVATEFGYGVASTGFTVISGGAFGIDAAAHRGAISVPHGLSVAVLPCGIDVAYPAAHAELFTQIARNGGVVSEYPPGVVPSRTRFLARNRLIAALSAATVVVEAGQRSEARSTVAHALALHRPVMAVPGPITSATSTGCHELIRAGTARLVTSPEHVLAHLPR